MYNEDEMQLVRDALEQRTRERDEARRYADLLALGQSVGPAELSSLRASAGALERLEKWLRANEEGFVGTLEWNPRDAFWIRLEDYDHGDGCEKPAWEGKSASLSAAIDAALAKAGGGEVKKYRAPDWKDAPVTRASRPVKPKAPVLLWAWYRDDLWPHYFDIGEYPPSTEGSDDDGAVFPRYGKRVRVEVRPLPAARKRKVKR